MQFQADVLGSPVAAPAVAEIAATGAAYAAGLATGFWSGLDQLRANYAITHRWQPEMDPADVHRVSQRGSRRRSDLGLDHGRSERGRPWLAILRSDGATPAALGQRERVP